MSETIKMHETVIPEYYHSMALDAIGSAIGNMMAKGMDMIMINTYLNAIKTGHCRPIKAVVNTDYTGDINTMAGPMLNRLRREIGIVLAERMTAPCLESTPAQNPMAESLLIAAYAEHIIERLDYAPKMLVQDVVTPRRDPEYPSQPLLTYTITPATVYEAGKIEIGDSIPERADEGVPTVYEPSGETDQDFPRGFNIPVMSGLENSSEQYSQDTPTSEE